MVGQFMIGQLMVDQLLIDQLMISRSIDDHQPSAAAGTFQPSAAGAVDPFNLAFAQRALFAAIKEKDPGAMFISNGTRFKLPGEIPVDDTAYEAAFTPLKISRRNSNQDKRYVVCHTIASRYQQSREVRKALWDYLRANNVYMRFSKLGVGSTTAVGWLKNFHPTLQNRDHLADRLSQVILQFGDLTEEEKTTLPQDKDGNHLPVIELVPSIVSETLNGKPYKCSAVQVRASTDKKDRVLENLMALANSDEGFWPESATLIPFTWSVTDKKLHVCAIKEHAKILEQTACISVGGMSQAMLDAEILHTDGSMKYVHTLFTEKDLKYEVTTASASKGIYRFLTTKEKLVEAEARLSNWYGIQQEYATSSRVWLAKIWRHRNAVFEHQPRSAGNDESLTPYQCTVRGPRTATGYDRSPVHSNGGWNLSINTRRHTPDLLS